MRNSTYRPKDKLSKRILGLIGELYCYRLFQTTGFTQVFHNINLLNTQIDIITFAHDIVKIYEVKTRNVRNRCSNTSTLLPINQKQLKRLLKVSSYIEEKLEIPVVVILVIVKIK